MEHKVITHCLVCRKEKLRYQSHAHLQTCGQKCKGLLKSLKHIEKASRPCKICGDIFVPKHNKSPGIYCSYACMARDKIKPIIVRSGYRYMYLPSHPMAAKQGYFAEHRFVIEQSIGRYLDRKEVVHHINHKKDDNRLENLILFASTGLHHAKCHPRKRMKALS